MIDDEDGPDLLNDLPEPDPELDALARRLVDAAVAIHIKLGPGLPESHYGNALCIEFRKRGIPFVPQAKVDVLYDGQFIGRCKIDFIIDQRLVLEIKSVEKLEPLFKAQVLTYLKITNCRLGLLINFNEERVARGTRRVINPYYKS